MDKGQDEMPPRTPASRAGKAATTGAIQELQRDLLDLAALVSKQTADIAAIRKLLETERPPDQDRQLLAAFQAVVQERDRLRVELERERQRSWRWRLGQLWRAAGRWGQL